jgi:hypothetical protein
VDGQSNALKVSGHVLYFEELGELNSCKLLQAQFELTTTISLRRATLIVG